MIKTSKPTKEASYYFDTQNVLSSFIFIHPENFYNAYLFCSIYKDLQGRGQRGRSFYKSVDMYFIKIK
jgi:hypothetical protein